MTAVVFESPTERNRGYVLSLLRKGMPVYVLEPFYAYHHRGPIRFFPPPLSKYIENLIDEGKIKVIPASRIDSRSIYIDAADSAVETVERVYPLYRKRVETIIRFVCKEIGPEVEGVFKKNLCDRLGGFFSADLLLQRLHRLFRYGSISFVPRFNMDEYIFLSELVRKSGEHVFESDAIGFSGAVIKRDKRNNLFKRFILVSKILFQAAGSLTTSFIRKGYNRKAVRKYKYGIGIIAPKRQFRGNQRGVDFLIDNKKILAKNVVYIPLVELDQRQKEQLRSLGSDIAFLPRLGRFFSNWTVWAKLVRYGLSKKKTPTCDIIEVAAISFFTYYRWRYFLEQNRIENFITHSDFPNSHVARNFILKKTGATTWYFTDASNFGHSFRTSDDNWNRHPFWAYQCYDNLVTWNEDLVEYFSQHPGSYRKSHVVGSLWSNHVVRLKNKFEFLRQYFDEELIDGKFVIVVYTSTYTINGETSYDEGILFAKHAEMLVENFEDILILVKEKKDLSFHLRVDPNRGKALIDQYERMEAHPRIKICSNKLDTSLAMGVSDLCISFPYTSTTNEAIGFGIPAIWHDPYGYYRKTPYARHGGMVTHGYEDLKRKVVEMKTLQPGSFKDPIKKGASLFDPYRDGRAIERFRDLLLAK